jgi:hypothetical protein
LRPQHWPKALTIQDQFLLKGVTSSVAALVVPAIKRVLPLALTVRPLVLTIVSNTVRPPLRLVPVPEQLGLGLGLEIQVAQRPAWPMLSEIFLAILEARIQIAATVASAVRRAPLLAPDSLFLGLPTASIGS